MDFVRTHWAKLVIFLVVVHVLFVQAAKCGYVSTDSVGRIKLG